MGPKTVRITLYFDCESRETSRVKIFESLSLVFKVSKVFWSLGSLESCLEVNCEFVEIYERLSL